MNTSILSNTDIHDDDLIVSVKDVSKKFCRNLRRSMYYGIIDLSKNLLGIKPDSTHLRRDEFWALRDINFELKRGDTLGLIGINGCGKTTLLRLLTGIFPPDKGEIAIKGRVGALIAVGAGFHPHMTGRENIYLNGSILGMTKKEIDSKFTDIVDFSEIGDFIDAPVATYSSGMRVRLGFSIATAIDPDLLLLDEILSVGDASFRNKCYDRIGNLIDKSAVVFVSHSMEQVSRICNKCLYLDKGESVIYGPSNEAVHLYMNNNVFDKNQSAQYLRFFTPISNVGFVWDSFNIKYGDTIKLTLSITSQKKLSDCLIRVVFYDLEGKIALEWNSLHTGKYLNLKKGKNKITIHFGPLFLQKGEYTVGFVINDTSGTREIVRSYRQYKIRVESKTIGLCSYQLAAHEDDGF